MNEPIARDALQLNIAGRVMLVMTRCGVTDMQRMPAFVSAVSDAVLRQLADRPDQSIERLIDDQLVLLEQAIRRRSLAQATESDSKSTVPSMSVHSDASAPKDPEVSPVPESEHAEEISRRPNHKGTAAPVVRSMEEKLKESREPVQKLVLDGCVAAGLVDPNKAQSLVAGMTGKQPEEAELEIVEYLREVLLEQVKTYIRQSKGGPWAAPRVQADLRADIHHALTVRGILTLARQIIKERREWEEANGKGGILGLFAGRH